MSAYARRVDANHADILQALRCSGLAVRDLSRAGDGVPDAIVSYGWRTALVEIKTGKGKLTAAQHEWARGWEGELFILRTVDEALA